MRIQYTGHSTRRVVAALEWNRANQFCVEVTDASLALNLLTQEGFAVANDEPLANLPGVGAQRVAELTLAGIASMQDLRALDENGIERIAAMIWASEDQVRLWVTIARNDPTESASEPEAIPSSPSATSVPVKKPNRRKPKK